MTKFTTTNASQMGQRGGQRTVEIHGRDHMSRIGKLGFQAMVIKRFSGDRRLALNTLIHKGLMAQDPVPDNRAWTKHDRIPDRLMKEQPTCHQPNATSTESSDQYTESSSRSHEEIPPF